MIILLYICANKIDLVMKLYLIDVSKICQAEIVGTIKSYSLPHTVEYLFHLKMEGYNKLYFDSDTHKLVYYTLNSDKSTYRLADGVKNILIDLIALGFEKPVKVKEQTKDKDYYTTLRDRDDNVDVVMRDETKMILDEYVSIKSILSEIDRITSLINKNGFSSLSNVDSEFYKKHSKYI